MADAIAMLRALLAGARYPPPGVEDTPENRATWDALVADLDAMAARGVIPDIPAD